MALCRKCRVREASDILYDGLCSYCYHERKKERKKEEQRDREQRDAQERERRRREEREREERYEERQHRERLEELKEQEVEYQRQAARDAEIAREEAEEARRIAGLTTFTCCHCQGTFNEERGYSAIESPIGKPVCNKCYELLKKCIDCNQYFWKNDPRSTPIRLIEKEYYRTKNFFDEPVIYVKDRNDYVCDNCASTAKYESFFAEQKKLKQEYDTQERIRREKEAAERAERERKEAAERAEQKRKEAEAAELARIKAKEEHEAWRAEQREQHQKALLINIFFGIFFTLLSIFAYCSLLPDKFTGLILGLILGIGITIIRFTSSWGYFDDFKEYLARLTGSIALGALVSAWLAFMADAFFTDTFVTPFSILSAILTPTASICIEKMR